MLDEQSDPKVKPFEWKLSSCGVHSSFSVEIFQNLLLFLQICGLNTCWLNFGQQQVAKFQLKAFRVLFYCL